jgi:hypothetical protein
VLLKGKWFKGVLNVISLISPLYRTNSR